MTKQETVQLVTLMEQVKNIKEDTDKIIKHQEYQNGKLADTIRAVDKSQEIAKAAETKAEDAKTCAKSTEKELGKMRIVVVAAGAFLMGSGILTGFGISNLIGG